MDEKGDTLNVISRRKCIFWNIFFRPVLLWRSLRSCPKTTRLIIATPLLDRLFQTLVFFYSKFPFELMSRNFLSLVFCLQFFNRPVHLDTKMSSSLGLHVSRLGKHKNGEGKDLMFFFQKKFTHIVCSFFYLTLVRRRGEMDSVTGQIREEHIHTPLRLSNRLGRGGCYIFKQQHETSTQTNWKINRRGANNNNTTIHHPRVHLFLV